MNRKALKIGAFVITFAAVAIGGGVFWLRHKFATKTAQHLVRVEWLPKEANDITYFDDPGLFPRFAYECAIPKEAFLKFAQKKQWTLKEERNFSSPFRAILNLPPVRRSDFYPLALVYEDIQKNGGGLTVIYDVELQKLFVHESAN